MLSSENSAHMYVHKRYHLSISILAERRKILGQGKVSDRAAQPRHESPQMIINIKHIKA
jgi:hypothetical protein